MRLGNDIIEIDRIKDAIERQPRFVEKILSSSELERYQTMSKNRQIEFLAGRFSAKEAYVKALQTGIGKIRFTDISIDANEAGVPIVTIAPIIKRVNVAISHCKNYATAVVIIDLPEEVIETQLNNYLKE